MEGSYKRFKRKTASGRSRIYRGYRPAVARRVGRNQAAHARAAYRRFRYRHNRVTMGVIGMELKYFHETAAANIASSSVAAGGQITPSATEMLFCPIIGDGPNNRDGRKVRLKSIQIRGVIRSAGYTGVGTHPPSTCVVVGYLIKDSQCNGVLADSGNMFDPSTLGSDMNFTSFRDLSTTARFKILKKQMWVFNNTNFAVNSANPPTAFYSAGFVRPFEWYVKEEEDVDFVQNAGDTNTVANLTKVNYITVFFTNNSGWSPAVTWQSRCRFIG